MNTPNGWRDVTPAEEVAARDNEWARVGRIYNGMTNAGLIAMFGQDNIAHVPGKGWITRDQKANR